MIVDRSFGEWLRQRRRTLDLTQEELARQVGCSAITLRKIEAEERRPSKQIAERLGAALQVAPDDQPAFLRFARGDPFAAPGGSIAPNEAQLTLAPRNNLPHLVSRFVGRERELVEVRQLLLGSARLLTITGPGGTGKTRLALEAAATLLAAFPEGTWWVELAPLTDPGLIPQTVASVLGLKEEPDRPILKMLTDHLRRKRTLLLLDNCEHLIQGSARLAEAVLSACPHVCLLATSRELLDVAGERTFAVPSLQTPEPNQALSLEQMRQYDAVRLFLDRVANTAPQFDLTLDNAAAVAEICRRLDGIPLALELAAARLRMMPVDQLATRLDDAFQLLTSGSRTALPRHQTLQALIDWSYDLLPPQEQTLLRRLAVFAGGWTLEAAEDICHGEKIDKPAVAQLLGRLIDKSLVQVEQPQAARYRTLETIRQYALAKLVASGEADDLRRRHMLFYLALAERGDFPTFETSLATRKTELDNLRAALAFSRSDTVSAELGLRLASILGPAFVALGFAQEGQGWLERALAHPAAGTYPEAQALAFWNLGSAVAGLAGYQRAEAYWSLGLKFYRDAGDKFSVAYLLSELGHSAREQGDTVTARLRLEESLALYRQLENKRGFASTLVTLAEVAVMLEDTDEAIRLLEEARPLIIPEADEFRLQGWRLNHLGHVAQIQGEYERATRLHEESLAVFKTAQNPLVQKIGTAQALQSLGETALAQGQTVKAAQHQREALAIFQDIDERPGLAWSLAGLAGAAALDEEPERAAWLWGAAEKLRLSVGVREAPCSHDTHERLKAQAREQIGEAAFAAEWAAGEVATLSEVLGQALS